MHVEILMCSVVIHEQQSTCGSAGELYNVQNEVTNGLLVLQLHVMEARS